MGASTDVEGFLEEASPRRGSWWEDIAKTSMPKAEEREETSPANDEGSSACGGAWWETVAESSHPNEAAKLEATLKTAAAEAPPVFHPSKTFTGAIEGFVFKLGLRGVGYYIEGYKRSSDPHFCPAPKPPPVKLKQPAWGAGPGSDGCRGYVISRFARVALMGPYKRMDLVKIAKDRMRRTGQSDGREERQGWKSRMIAQKNARGFQNYLEQREEKLDTYVLGALENITNIDFLHKKKGYSIHGHRLDSNGESIVRVKHVKTQQEMDQLQWYRKVFERRVGSSLPEKRLGDSIEARREALSCSREFIGELGAREKKLAKMLEKKLRGITNPELVHPKVVGVYNIEGKKNLPEGVVASTKLNKSEEAKERAVTYVYKARLRYWAAHKDIVSAVTSQSKKMTKSINKLSPALQQKICEDAVESSMPQIMSSNVRKPTAEEAEELLKKREGSRVYKGGLGLSTDILRSEFRAELRTQLKDTDAALMKGVSGMSEPNMAALVNAVNESVTATPWSWRHDQELLERLERRRKQLIKEQAEALKKVVSPWRPGGEHIAEGPWKPLFPKHRGLPEQRPNTANGTPSAVTDGTRSNTTSPNECQNQSQNIGEGKAPKSRPVSAPLKCTTNEAFMSGITPECHQVIRQHRVLQDAYSAYRVEPYPVVNPCTNDSGSGIQPPKQQLPGEERCQRQLSRDVTAMERSRRERTSSAEKRQIERASSIERSRSQQSTEGSRRQHSIERSRRQQSTEGNRRQHSIERSRRQQSTERSGRQHSTERSRRRQSTERSGRQHSRGHARSRSPVRSPTHSHRPVTAPPNPSIIQSRTSQAGVIPSELRVRLMASSDPVHHRVSMAISPRGSRLERSSSKMEGNQPSLPTRPSTASGYIRIPKVHSLDSEEAPDLSVLSGEAAAAPIHSTPSPAPTPPEVLQQRPSSAAEHAPSRSRQATAVATGRRPFTAGHMGRPTQKWGTSWTDAKAETNEQLITHLSGGQRGRASSARATLESGDLQELQEGLINRHEHRTRLCRDLIQGYRSRAKAAESWDPTEAPLHRRQRKRGRGAAGIAQQERVAEWDWGPETDLTECEEAIEQLKEALPDLYLAVTETALKKLERKFSEALRLLKGVAAVLKWPMNGPRGYLAFEKLCCIKEMDLTHYVMMVSRLGLLWTVLNGIVETHGLLAERNELLSEIVTGEAELKQNGGYSTRRRVLLEYDDALRESITAWLALVPFPAKVLIEGQTFEEVAQQDQEDLPEWEEWEHPQLSESEPEAHQAADAPEMDAIPESERGASRQTLTLDEDGGGEIQPPEMVAPLHCLGNTTVIPTTSEEQPEEQEDPVNAFFDLAMG